MNNIFLDIIGIIYIIITGYLKYIFGFTDYDKTIINLLTRLANYNILFIKMFQWTIDNNLLTNKIKKFLNTYSDNAPYNNNDIDHTNLLKLMQNSNKLEIFNMNKPINSGSISLIFKGKLDNKPIIIKILRKNIKEDINKGLNLLIIIVNLLKYIPTINVLQLDKMIETNKSNLLNQINFVNEVNNLETYYSKFKTHKYIVTPQVYSKYTNIHSNLIIMEFIEGKHLYEIPTNELINYHSPFAKFMIKSIFDKNIIHGDLHQGNLLFFSEIVNNKIVYKIGIIDMGMMFKLDVDNVNFLYMFLAGVFDNKFMDFINYLEIPKNQLTLFKESDNNFDHDNFIKNIKNKYINKEIFKDFTNLKQICDDMYLFIKIVKQNNCELKKNILELFLSLIPIFSICDRLGVTGSNKNTCINEEICRLQIT